jgi:MFS family permease
VTGVTAYATSVFQWLMLFSLAYYQTLYLEVGKGYTAVMAGVFLLPYTVTIAPGAAVTGVLIAKTGKYQKAVWVGWALTTFGFGLLIIPDQNTSAVSLVFIPLAAGLGFGVLTSAQKFPAQAYASNVDLPFASGLNMFFRSLGQMFGVAVGGVIFQNALSRKISEYPHFAQYADEWSSNASALAELIRRLGPDMQEMKAVLVDSYVAAFREIWIVMTVFGGVSLLAVLFGVKEKSLERSHETDQGLVTAGRKAAKTEQV